MKLKRLKEICDFALETNGDDADVIITLDEPSIGGRAGVGIACAGRGIDWESWEFRIDPETPLVRRGRTEDDPLRMRCTKYEYDTRTQTIYRCPICEERLKKEMKYCFSCGQKVLADSKIDRIQSLKTRK